MWLKFDDHGASRDHHPLNFSLFKASPNLPSGLL
jgi:hypothetical protein